MANEKVPEYGLVKKRFEDDERRVKNLEDGTKLVYFSTTQGLKDFRSRCHVGDELYIDKAVYVGNDDRFREGVELAGGRVVKISGGTVYITGGGGAFESGPSASGSASVGYITLDSTHLKAIHDNLEKGAYFGLYMRDISVPYDNGQYDSSSASGFYILH